MSPPDANDSFADEVEDRLEKLFGEDFLADDDSADTADKSEDLVPDDALSIAEEDTGEQIPEDAENFNDDDADDLAPDIFEDASTKGAEVFTPDVNHMEKAESKIGSPPNDSDMKPDSGVANDSDTSVESPLRELKAIVLSIDWEINDEVMTRFVDQIAILKSTFEGDKVVLVFLQLLNSIGEYIRVNLGRSHPDAFKILNSLFLQMDKVVNSSTMTGTEKKKTLAVELEKYKNLKDRLTPEPPAADTRAKDSAQDEVSVSDIDIRKLYSAIHEIKKVLQTEILSLKKEIDQIKNFLAKRG